MAHYKKRPKVKRYRRSFYSREMKLKKGIGIAVLVLAVLGIGWLAAPHVLDWATHTRQMALPVWRSVETC